jgi:DNA protecting protein DprA
VTQPGATAARPTHSSARPAGSETIDEVRAARIILAHLAEPGRRDLGELVRAVGPVEALARIRAGAVPAQLREVTAARMSTMDLAETPYRALAEAARVGARIVTPEDDEWPARLDDLVVLSRPVADPIERDTDPPLCVWVRGPLALRDACERSVAVVGARASTSYGDHVAADLAYGLAERGWTVVSGGAYGIDAAAHRGALAAAGPTIAVLACGVDRCYPTSHRLLFDRIAETGLIFSEWPPGADPHRHRFLVRNRVIAALARGTVVVEAALRSGARSTLRRARQLGRLAMVVPGPVTSALSAGAHEELREPDTILVARTDHIVDAVGTIGADLAPVARAEPTARDALTRLERQVLDGVRPRKILTAEEIARAVGVSPREARATLPALERARFVTAVGGGYRLWRKSDDLPPPRSGRTKRAASTVETARGRPAEQPPSRHGPAQHEPATPRRQDGGDEDPTGQDGRR